MRKKIQKITMTSGIIRTMSINRIAGQRSHHTGDMRSTASTIPSTVLPTRLTTESMIVSSSPRSR